MNNRLIYISDESGNWEKATVDFSTPKPTINKLETTDFEKANGFNPNR